MNDDKTEYIIVNRREVNFRQDEIMKLENLASKELPTLIT